MNAEPTPPCPPPSLHSSTSPGAGFPPSSLPFLPQQHLAQGDSSPAPSPSPYLSPRTSPLPPYCEKPDDKMRKTFPRKRAAPLMEATVSVRESGTQRYSFHFHGTVPNRPSLVSPFLFLNPDTCGHSSFPSVGAESFKGQGSLVSI